MDAERWQTVQDLLTEALELPAPERESLLEDRCGDDPALRAEVLSLIEAAEAADNYFDDLAGRAGMAFSMLSDLSAEEAATGRRSARSDPLEALIGKRIGQYHILERIGEGGMATVFLAEREGEGFTQRVALKLVSKQVSDPLIQRRSNEERRILARLEHRGIARLIDGGVTPDGYPYYAMEYVEGLNVLEYCDSNRLRVKDRLRLFLEVCAPVRYAHQRLVVHCDLKPSNILVTEDGHAKLLDFGVARLIDPDAAGDEATGLWFTPAYASPEQVRREPPGTHSDVYSLGVLLYDMLTGHRPYRFDTRSPAEVRRIVCEAVPERPSGVVTRPARRTRRGRPTDISAEELCGFRRLKPDRMRKRLQGDLDAIVMKALAKDPEDRYHTAEQLAEDVRRHIEGWPLLARPRTAPYRLAKFVRRNRRVVAAGGVVLVTLMAGVFGTIWQARRATEAAALATDEAEKAELVATLMMDLFRLSDPSEALGDTITAREMLDRGAERILAELGDQPVVQARLLGQLGAVYSSLGLLSQAEPLVRRSLELRETQLGGASIEASESLAQLGELMVLLGEPDAAIEALERAIDVREPLVAFPDSLLAHTQAALAWQLRANRRYDEAAALFSTALETERALGDARPQVATVLLGLASTFHDEGRFDEADSLFTTVLADFDLTGRPHPLAVSALVNVGLIRRLREQYLEAEPLLRTAMEMSEVLYGSDHVAVASAKGGWALVLAALGRYEQAEGIFRDAIARSEAAVGPLHPTTAGLQEGLAGVLQSVGEYDEAVDLHTLSLEDKVRRHGRDDHPGIVVTLNSIGASLVGGGRFDDARTYFGRAQEMNERLSGGKSVYRIHTFQGIANIAWQEGDFASADDNFTQAMALADELLRPNHRYTLRLKHDYGVYLIRAGRRPEAAEALRWVLGEREVLLPEPHPEIARTRQALEEALRSGP